MQETSAATAAKAADGLPASKASLEEHQQNEAPWSDFAKGHVGFHEIPKDGKLQVVFCPNVSTSFSVGQVYESVASRKVRLQELC